MYSGKAQRAVKLMLALLCTVGGRQLSGIN